MKQTYKIGIAIVHCLSKGNSSGFEVVHTTDKDNWIDTIEDTGRVFNYVANTSESIIRLIKLDSEGWYICSMIPTTDREHEYRASWIYLPVAINLKASDIKSILAEVESQITTSDYDESKLNDLAQRYSFEGTTSYPHFIIPSDQKGYAIRYVGGENPNLYDIFDNIYQKEYCKYNWIVLLPEIGTELVPESNITNITGCKFSTSVIISPDCDSKGFTPYINNRPFSTPVRLFEGEVVTVLWKKPGYLDISSTVSKQEELIVPSNRIYRQFASNFTVVDRLTQRPIFSPQINMITKFQKDSYGYIYIAEKDLHDVTFSVSAPGYESDEFCMDFSKIQIGGSIPTVELDPEEHKYTFLLPVDSEVVKDRKRVKIEIKSQYKILDSPIKGYTCVGRISEDRDNELRLKPQVIGTSGESGKTKSGKQVKGEGETPIDTNHKGGKHHRGSKPLSKVLQYVIIALLVLTIVGLAWFLFFMDEESQPYTPPTNPPAEVVDTPQGQIDSWKDAFEALKGCETVWDKDILSKYKDLDGVYDMINKYKFAEIISFYNNHESDLSKIDDWNRLYQYAQKKVDKTGEYSQDGKITISTYLRKISELADKPNTTSSSGASSSSVNRGASSSSTATNGTDNKETNTNWE